jgi:glutaredoxin
MEAQAAHNVGTGAEPSSSTGTEGYTLFVQPGCSSCLRTKEFLTRHQVPFRVVDVMNEPGAQAQLQALGVRHIPLVVRGTEFAYGQNIDDVARFVGVELPRLPRLDPDVLVQRWMRVLDVAMACMRQMPDSIVRERPIPNRAGTILALGYHVFLIPRAFLDCLNDGVEDWIVNSMREPTAELDSGSAVARRGAEIKDELAQWWKGRGGIAADDTVRTFQGEQSLHWFLERSCWHSAQHTRQLVDVLEQRNIQPHDRLSADDLKGLPVPQRVWE